MSNHQSAATGQSIPVIASTNTPASSSANVHNPGSEAGGQAHVNYNNSQQRQQHDLQAPTDNASSGNDTVSGNQGHKPFAPGSTHNHSLSGFSSIRPPPILDPCADVTGISVVPMASPTGPILPSPLSTLSFNLKQSSRVFENQGSNLNGGGEDSKTSELTASSNTQSGLTTHDTAGREAGHSKFFQFPPSTSSMPIGSPKNFDAFGGPLPSLPRPSLHEVKDSQDTPLDGESLDIAPIWSNHDLHSNVNGCDVVPSQPSIRELSSLVTNEFKQVENQATVVPGPYTVQTYPSKRIRREAEPQRGGCPEFRTEDGDLGETCDASATQERLEYVQSQLFEGPLRSPNAPRKMSFCQSLWDTPRNPDLDQYSYPSNPSGTAVQQRNPAIGRPYGGEHARVASDPFFHPFHQPQQLSDGRMGVRRHGQDCHSGGGFAAREYGNPCETPLRAANRLQESKETCENAFDNLNHQTSSSSSSSSSSGQTVSNVFHPGVGSGSWTFPPPNPTLYAHLPSRDNPSKSYDQGFANDESKCLRWTGGDSGNSGVAMGAWMHGGVPLEDPRSSHVMNQSHVAAGACNNDSFEEYNGMRPVQGLHAANPYPSRQSQDDGGMRSVSANSMNPALSLQLAPFRGFDCYETEPACESTEYYDDVAGLTSTNYTSSVSAHSHFYSPDVPNQCQESCYYGDHEAPQMRSMPVMNYADPSYGYAYQVPPTAAAGFQPDRSISQFQGYPDESLARAQNSGTRHGFRRLPVVEDGLPCADLGPSSSQGLPYNPYRARSETHDRFESFEELEYEDNSTKSEMEEDSEDDDESYEEASRNGSGGGGKCAHPSKGSSANGGSNVENAIALYCQDLREGRVSERLRSTTAPEANGRSITPSGAGSINSGTAQLVVEGDDYLCLTCNRRFKKLAALRRHERIHVQGRPYACTWPHCNRRFSERANLKRHIKIHLGQRDFVCKIPGCSQKFGRKSHLVHHLSGAKHAKVSLEWYLDEATLRAVEECRLRRSIKPRRRSLPAPNVQTDERHVRTASGSTTFATTAAAAAAAASSAGNTMNYYGGSALSGHGHHANAGGVHNAHLLSQHGGNGVAGGQTGRRK